MKILLFGKNGQVGHELQRTLLPFGEVIALGREEVDLAQASAVQHALRQYAPAIIVNAAAYTAVDKAESEADAAHAVNAAAVGAMAAYARQRDSLLLHYSTDYVFDGSKPGPYLESDATNPQSVYGASKLAGEQAILASGCRALILRTSWVHSAHGGNFIKTILRLAQERDTLRVVNDQFGAPTSAELIADVSALAILAHHLGKLPEGLYHLTASGETSWHGLAQYVLRRARENGMELKLDAAAIAAIPTAGYPTPAKRPHNSRLDCSRLQQALGLQLPDWRSHVDRTVDQLTLNG